LGDALEGNGLTIEEWLTYASPQSLSLYMFQKPKSAKRLHFDVIPRAVDEYLQLVAGYERQDARQQLDNAAWHIHSGHPPKAELPISFALLLNLVAASNAEDKAVLWGFIRRHVPDASPESYPVLDHLAGYAVNYYRDLVKPKKVFRPADEVERGALRRGRCLGLGDLRLSLAVAALLLRGCRGGSEGAIAFGIRSVRAHGRGEDREQACGGDREIAEDLHGEVQE